MTKGKELKLLLIAACCYFLIILLLVFSTALSCPNPATQLGGALSNEDKVRELIKLQSMGVPADIVVMLMGYGCESEQEILERQTIYYALDFLVLHETVFVFECTCPPAPEEPPLESEVPTPPPECDCEYEPQEPVEYRGKAAILKYLRLTEDSGTLTVDNLEDIITAQAQALCDSSPEDDKREVFIGVVAPTVYPDIVNTYIEDENDLQGILELHEDGYFIAWLSEAAKSFGISSGLEFLGRYPMPASGNITSPFGWRMHPILNKKNFHTGIDIGTSKHTNIYSIADGQVVGVSRNEYDGQYVLVYHENEPTPFYSYYAHLSKQLVRVGDAVQQGDVVGIEGGDKDDPYPGYSTGHHLHFEIRMSQHGDQINPLSFLKGGTE